MRRHWNRFYSRARAIFFGPPYHAADHSALSPKGSATGIRLVLIVSGTLWLSLVLFDNLARPWQRRPKSWQFFQGSRELNESPNQPLQRDFTRTKGDLGRDLGVASLSRYYSAAEDSTPVYLETDEQGFRIVRSSAPFTAVLCGDSFSNNNSFADSLARVTGLSVGNQAIEGRGTLTMARFLEDQPAPYRQAKLVIWESTQRAKIDAFTELSERRKSLRLSDQHRWQWRESLLWPANLDVYLSGSSLLKPLMDKIQKEIKWALLKKHTDLIILGRRDLPAGVAPMLFLGSDEAIRPRKTSQSELDSIATYIAAIDQELKGRGQHLIFTVAPEKSVVYPDRLPPGLTPRTNYITGLNQALQQHGVHVVDLSQGLREAAQAQPKTLYYYAADTHWTPKGMQLASRIIADSLKRWNFTVAPFAQR
ncbi:hypothetical protein IC235_10540 [Hymenobacter sp. BT664]|uniref:AlgX/AlgJ SGNH hydrolase-like domain-containing protein n=1 Tax=Hymenobacter montanus TaxID=2771359 RepID=A0A927BDE6_9BACT|nr:hypothetical protein [Hymenobacter montanus]MBD2768331.1 hypothetical protein [Hymenobacter montanus]